jgi:ribonuclease-3
LSSRSERAITAEARGAARAAAPLIEGLGVELDPELLVLALTHRSFAHEAGGIPTNERLEFLGDSVVGLVVTERLYRSNPELPEGDLAKMRAATVSQRALARIARSIGLGRFVLLGRGEKTTGGAEKDSILCDTLEAVLGAVYVAHGLERTRTVIERLVGPALDRAARLGAALDWKTSLQELSAGLGAPAPEYRSEGSGPDHARRFTADVLLGEKVAGTGSGTSKKAAEQAAAEDAYTRLESEGEGGPGRAGAAGERVEIG